MFKKNSGLCSECFESITNPICFDCLEKQVEALICAQPPSIKLAVRTELKRIKNAAEDIGQTTRCIICGKSAEVCPFCFMESLRAKLAKYNLKTLSNEINLILNYRDFGDY